MAKPKHPFKLIKPGEYRNGRFSIIKHGLTDWRLYEEFDCGGNILLADEMTKAGCLFEFAEIIRNRQRTWKKRKKVKR